MNTTHYRLASFLLALIVPSCAAFSGREDDAVTRGCVVYQTDFGLKDGAVASMKGVARAVDPTLALFDLTHEIPPYDIRTAAIRLRQTVPYWPEGTVFVSVVDPGVGTPRLPIVVEDAAGHFIVTPDNGTLTFMSAAVGLRAARVIDVERWHRPESDVSATFHGRDVFSYVGALLAARKVTFDEIGPPLELGQLVLLDVPQATFAENRRVLIATVEAIDEPYGNVWTNVPATMLAEMAVMRGAKLHVRISKKEGTTWRDVYEGVAPFCATFGDVPEGQPLAYLNSLDRLAFALNMGDFARAHGIGAGPEWTITIDAVR